MAKCKALTGLAVKGLTASQSINIFIILKCYQLLGLQSWWHYGAFSLVSVALTSVHYVVSKAAQWVWTFVTKVVLYICI